MATMPTEPQRAGVPIEEGSDREEGGGGDDLTSIPHASSSSGAPPASTSAVSPPLRSSFLPDDVAWWEEGLQHAAIQRVEETHQGKNRKKNGPKNISSQPLKPTPVCRSPFTQTNRTNHITDALDDLAFTTLHYLQEEQSTLRKKHSLQFKSRLRYVIGLHEVLKWLRAGRLQMVLMASDIERWDNPGIPAEATNTREEGEGRSPSPSPASAAVGTGATTTMDRTRSTVAPPPASSQRRTFRSIGEALDWIQAGCGIELPHASGKKDAAMGNANETLLKREWGGEEGRAVPHSASWRATSAGAAEGEKEAPPLCITCLTRHSMAYALKCGGRSQVACVGIVQAEKYLYLVKALKAYGKALSAPFSFF